MKNEPSWLVGCFGGETQNGSCGLDIEAAEAAGPVTVPQNSLVDILSMS